MKTIWKYDINPYSKLKIPKGAEILSVQCQKDKSCIWVLVDPSNEKELRVFRGYGTGHELPDNPGKFIGTFQLFDGDLVFHLFEETIK